MADSPLRFPYDCRMGIIGWIILGLLAGSIARAILPGHRGPGGCIGTTVVGVLGALLKRVDLPVAADYACVVGAQNVRAVDTTSGVGTWEQATAQLDAPRVAPVIAID